MTRGGLHKFFEILIDICNQHTQTQCFIVGQNVLLKTCHWIENTSDTAAGIDLGGIGLLAETLLDALKENNSQVNTLVEDLRGATKRLKKEIAEE